MYKSIQDKLIINVLEKANEWSLQERQKYNAYAEIIEDYIQEHNLIVADETGVDVMLGKPFNKNSYPYIVYSQDAEIDGFNIADKLYDNTHYKYIQAISQLNGQEIQVKIGDRTIIRLIQLEEYKGISLISLTDPKTHTGFFNKNLLCISVDVQLARLYRQLSSPAYVDNWEKLIKDEKLLFELIKNKATGGQEDIDPPETEYLGDIIGGSAEKNDLIKIVEDLNGFVINNGVKLQVAGTDPDELEKSLKAKYNGQIQKTTQFPKIPCDYRLIKHTYYLLGDKKQPIIDLFNIDTYDPIPVKNNQAHFLVQMRIILIEIWTIKLIKNIGQIDEKFADRRIGELYKELCDARPDDLTIDDIDVLKHGYTYIGIMDRDKFARSKVVRKLRHTNETYFPAQ